MLMRTSWSQFKHSLGFVFITGLLQASTTPGGITANAQAPLQQFAPPQSVCTKAQLFTVRIQGGENWGTGILIQRQGNLYSVLTNQHVLKGEHTQYPVITHDGATHPAKIFKRFTGAPNTQDDLAILQFATTTNYSLAELAQWQSGQSVFAVGFPITEGTPYFSCTPIVAARKLPKAMREGYQIGYPINIANGMSGGSLVNLQGQVVGVNGKGQPAIFVNPTLYVYRDGTQVNEDLEKLSKLSWAIPIEIAVSHRNSKPLQLSLQSSDRSSLSVGQASPTSPINALPIPSNSRSLSTPPNKVNAQPSSSITPTPHQTSSATPPPTTNPQPQTQPTSLTNSQPNTSQITDIAKFVVAIAPNNPQSTERVISGSGVLIGASKQTRYILADRSAINSSISYTAFTQDGQTHALTLIGQEPKTGFTIFSFESPINYPIATLESSQTPNPQETIYVAQQNYRDGKLQFTLNPSQIIHKNPDLTMSYRPLPINSSNGVLFNQKGYVLGIQKSPNSGISIQAFLRSASEDFLRVIIMSHQVLEN